MKRIVCLFLMLGCSVLLVCEDAEGSVSFDFVMQDIQDIVYAISVAQGVSIVCDDTVVGKTSFRFSGAGFEKAADAFLRSNRLYARLVGDIIVLSKVSISVENEMLQTYTIHAYDILPSVLFNKLSEFSHIPIMYELLPSTAVSLHVKNVKVEEAVSIVMQAFPEYTVNRDLNSIYVNKKAFLSGVNNQSSGSIFITEDEGKYSVDIQNAYFFESLEKMFALSGYQFCNLTSNNGIIKRLLFSHSDFDAVLKTLCAQADATFTLSNNMYIIYGFESASTDLKNASKFWKTIFLKHINTEKFSSLMASRFPFVKVLILSDTTAQVEVTAKEALAIDVFLNLCDSSEKTKLVQLQYITSNMLLEHLPPGIRQDQFSDLGNGNSLFFTGSDDAYAVLNDALSVLDKPSTTIGYDVLVLQVQESASFNWNPSFSAQKSSIGDTTSISGHLGSVFALNLDVVTVFGYRFAAGLQTAIAENKAEVYVDTHLQGISGSPIHFQNTNTFRYQDTAIDQDTGKPVYSGVTREIIAGLVLNIEGWVSGDGMVTTKVTASLSRRGADVSETGNPPPTSEKIVTTEVQGKSGEPIVLSGLVQNDSTFVEEAVPALSKIPLLGWLFKSHDKTEEKTEMIIYLVPHVENVGKEVFDDF